MLFILILKTLKLLKILIINKFYNIKNNMNKWIIKYIKLKTRKLFQSQKLSKFY